MLLNGAECAVRVYTEPCEPHFTLLCVRYGVWYVRPKRRTFVRVCVYVCVYGGRHEQPERCTHCRKYVCMYVYGVWHIRTEWCTFRAELCVRGLAQCSACAVRTVHLFYAACTVHPLHVSGVEHAPRTCIYTVFGMSRLSDAPIVRKYSYVSVHPVRERVQCSAWVA